jgi:hypothetical protein
MQVLASPFMRLAIQLHNCQTASCSCKDTVRPSHQLETIKAFIQLLNSLSPYAHSIAFTRHVINNHYVIILITPHAKRKKE